MKKIKKIVIILLSFLVVPGTIAGKVYIWKDEAGNIQMTDFPPSQDTQMITDEKDSQTLSEANVINSGPPKKPIMLRPFEATQQTQPTISLYERYKIQLERNACPQFGRGSHVWSDCRDRVKKIYGEICRDAQRNMQKDLRLAYCALADYMTVIE